MNLPLGYDTWKLASPEDDAPYLIECEGCGVKVLEDEATPINDGSTDHHPLVCEECAR